MIPKKIEIRLESEVNDSFRCKLACDSLDIDASKKNVHTLIIDNIDIKENWSVGIVYGASGSGKTTMAKAIFGEDIFKSFIDENEPIINQFPKDFTYDECAEILNGIGLTSVPCWVRPVKTLSNGQKARAEAALAISTSSKDIIVIDEWTSVVDRTVAKVMSLCIQKFARKKRKKIILLSCHNDIIEWVKPDWVIDCNKQEFLLPKSEDFFFTEREKLTFEIREIDRKSWKYFSKYHYLSEELPAGKIHCFGLFHNNIQIGFQCLANYTPIKKGTIPIFHSNRTVIHPDYAGLGLGIKLINESCRYAHGKYKYKLMAKFASIPVFKAMKKQSCWKFIAEKRLMTKMKVGGSLIRRSGFREKGSKTFIFEYVP